ncbi:hypothetical protein PVAND_012806 [Polypedilum vanderplanki]|uniref:Metalloendopeptidase n=1 Tax=Polypedilum vanderplanki TaxID=319348 RepID=A0A9J6CNP4_POLVA|nr:hypothetical protein PVAND_012806 [Polypedilum vanderplanki]
MAIFQLVTSIFIAITVNTRARAHPSINQSFDVPIENGEFTPLDIAGYLRLSDDIDIELGDKFEGDIVEVSRNSSLWLRKAKKIIVPFIIDEDSGFSPKQIYKILTAMQEIEEVTCIDFKWRENEDDFIFIYSGNGCNSYIGRIKGWQPLSLNIKSACGNSKGVIIHQLMHALGIRHMHNHPSRDNYIIIDENNLRDDAKRNFVKYESDEMNLTYDYYSIMHYGSFAFSKNGHQSVITINEFYQRIIGQRNYLSPGDIKRLRKMYKCNCIEIGQIHC